MGSTALDARTDSRRGTRDDYEPQKYGVARRVVRLSCVKIQSLKYGRAGWSALRAAFQAWLPVARPARGHALQGLA